ncbi:Uncharacterised protein [Bordetella pertussis]|nr:Uncharacterised protein [Bordetella pertussis]CFW32361.1 Uncharacterised protein [Bordetella pertussis]
MRKLTLVSLLQRPARSANWRCESSTFLNNGFSAERLAIISSQILSCCCSMASGVL